MLHSIFKAYKSDLFGARYVWILIGTYTHEWWSVPDTSLRCTKEEMKKAVAYTFIFNNQIFVSEDKRGAQNKTLSGLVSICLLVKINEIPVVNVRIPLFCVPLQTTRQFYKQYKEELRRRNLSSAPNITAYTYDAVWTVAASINKSIPKLEAMGLQLQDFYRNKTAMTRLFVQTVQDINFLGVTVSNELIFVPFVVVVQLLKTLLLQTQD